MTKHPCKIEASAAGRELIFKNTVEGSCFLCPEIKLRLITDRCPLWKAGERELEKIGLPEPYWGFAWAGGQALARFIMDNPEVVERKRVLDFGSGCAVELLAALKAGASSGVAADIDPLAAEAAIINAGLNELSIKTTTEDLIGSSCDRFDVILAGDMFYDPMFSSKVLNWLSDLASAGKLVLLGDPQRGNLKGARLKLMARYMAPSDVDIGGRYLRETFVCSILGCINK
jgi:predicted nicotinamide N-methyase